jgi:hypothetical protein
MSDHVLKTLEDLERKLNGQVAAVVATKRLINQLCEIAGIPARYQDAEAELKAGPSLSIRSDQFYGQPQATCVKEILQMRKALNQGPATVAEIYAALVEGGFAFDTKNDENAKRGLRISITKNTALFHKLPNGRIGLLEWYPNARGGKAKRAAGATSDDDADESAPENDDGGKQ